MESKLYKSFKPVVLMSASLIALAMSENAQAAAALTSVSVNPNIMASGSTSTVTVSVSEPCPSGGCVVGMYSQQAVLFPVPAQITIPAGAISAAVPVKVGINNSSTMRFQVSANYNGVYKSTYPWIEQQINGPVLTAMSLSGAYVYSGKALQMSFTVSEACPAGGCAISLYSNNSSLIKLPSSFIIPQGQTQAILTVSAGSTSYPQPVSFSASYVKAIYSPSDFAVFAALSAPAADGSYMMQAFGSSSRTGTGSVTKSQNDQMAKNNMLHNLNTWVKKQCQAVYPNGILTNVGSPIKKGEFKDANGLLTITYTQNVKCSK